MEVKFPHPLHSRPVSAESSDDQAGTGGRFHRPVRPLKPRHASEVPNRYAVKEDEGGLYLSCVEAPEVKVRIDPAMAVTGGAARKAPEGTIYLDGAAQSAPFLDLERRVYNLDHHEGCVRPFTLATCEQALVLVARGLDVREQPWQVWANEPDLDTVLALWLLLNSMHLQERDSPIREAVIPLVRLEGTIDSHGLEQAELTGYPPDLTAEMQGRLQRLRELRTRSEEQGRGEPTDLLETVSTQLQALDKMLYPADFFEDFRGIEELAKVELSDNRIAVVCRCDCGIYELEKELKRLYGKRLGVVVLEKGGGFYTLRQVDPFLPVDLEAAYRKLNVLDPAVTTSDSADRWGGSGEIGGSPRRSGTSLSPADLAEVLRLAYRRPTVFERVKSVVTAIGVSLVPMSAGWAAAWLSGRSDKAIDRLIVDHSLEFLAVSFTVALLGLWILGRQSRFRQFGLQWPAGRRWMLVTPAVILGAVAGGAWLFWPVSVGGLLPGPRGWIPWLALLGFPLLAELLFRGLAHGVMVHNFSVQHSQGRWFLSWPIAVSALLFALATIPFYYLTLAAILWPLVGMISVPLGALICGIGLGFARERSDSLLAPLALHYLAVIAVLAAGAILR